MDKVSYIKQLSNDAAHLGSDDFIRALILALEPEESAELLQQSLVGDSTLRRSALRKVCADIETGKVANSSEILAGLKHKVLHGEPRYRNGYAYCLLEVSRVCDSDARIGTQSFLGSSKYVGLRRRSYKLYDPASPQSQTLLNAAWDEYHDKEAAWLIVKHFPPEFLAQNRAKLANVLSEGWQLSKLYLRLVEVEATAVEELFTVDSVSYLYVMAKLGHHVSPRRLSSIIEASLGDERFGLVLWCMGKLKEWDQIVTALPLATERAKMRFSEISRSGI